MSSQVAAKRMWETADDGTVINTEVYPVTLNPSIRGLYFAFQDEGSCVSIMSIRVFYITCPQIIVNYARFNVSEPAMTAPFPLQIFLYL
jgi:ephrin-B